MICENSEISHNHQILKTFLFPLKFVLHLIPNENFPILRRYCINTFYEKNYSALNLDPRKLILMGQISMMLQKNRKHTFTYKNPVFCRFNRVINFETKNLSREKKRRKHSFNFRFFL